MQDDEIAASAACAERAPGLLGCVVQTACDVGSMLVAAATLRSAIRRAVAAAVREADAPFSAWPERYPGSWATARRIAEILGRRTAEITFHLHGLVEVGEVISAAPWPAGLRGYQPVALAEEVPLLALPEPISDERQWLLDELVRWGFTAWRIGAQANRLVKGARPGWDVATLGPRSRLLRS